MSASIQDQLDTLLKFEEWRAEKLLSPPEFDIAAYIEELQNEANRELLAKINAFAMGELELGGADPLFRIASLTKSFATSKEISEV